MDETIVSARLAVLKLATQICETSGEPDKVIVEAQKYWEWINGSHDAAKTPSPQNEDDIPF